jgi:hypothetical protein
MYGVTVYTRFKQVLGCRSGSEFAVPTINVSEWWNQEASSAYYCGIFAQRRTYGARILAYAK